MLTKYFDDPTFISQFRDHFTKGKPYNSPAYQCSIKSDPFPVGIIKNILSNEDALELLSEMKQMNYIEKNNDLYEFRQSKDLIKNELVGTKMRQFKELISSTEMVKFMEDITGLELNFNHSYVDMACQCYSKTHRLLCHDDKLEGRKIAFIYYLVDTEWTLKDGGTLDLFNTNEAGNPKEIVTRVIPQWNSLAFFQVSPISYHQVAEVLSDNKNRWSITGWFYERPKVKPETEAKLSKTISRRQEAIDARHSYALRASNPSSFQFLYEWITPEYLKEGSMNAIRSQFIKESTVQLSCFLLPQKYNALQIQSNSKSTYLPDLHKFTECEIHDLQSIFLSNEFAFYLSKITGLSGFSVADFLGHCQFSKGDYTLLHDDHAYEPVGLDLIYYTLAGQWNSDAWGGQKCYLSEDQVLLTIPPMPNCLNLVYRDDDVFCFTKYVNSTANDSSFIETRMIYH